MAGQRRQDPNSNPLAGQCRDEAPPSRVTGHPIQPGLPMDSVHRLAKGVGREAILLLRAQEALRRSPALELLNIARELSPELLREEHNRAVASLCLRCVEPVCADRQDS